MRRVMNSAFVEPKGTELEQVRSYGLTCDMKTKGDHYLLSFDVPGVPKEEINIDVEDGKLKVWGERKFEHSEDDYIEKHYGRFERSVSLPKGVDESQIAAHYENGVLNIALPKAEESMTRKIEISDNKKEGLWDKLLGNKTDSEQTTKV